MNLQQYQAGRAEMGRWNKWILSETAFMYFIEYHLCKIIAIVLLASFTFVGVSYSDLRIFILLGVVGGALLLVQDARIRRTLKEQAINREKMRTTDPITYAFLTWRCPICTDNLGDEGWTRATHQVCEQTSELSA